MRFNFLLQTITLLACLKSGVSQAQTPNLGATASFSAFTASGAVGNTGTAPRINGDVGTANGAITGFGLGQVTGIAHSNDGLAAQAALDVRAAYADLGQRACGTTLTTLGGNPQTLIPGVYCTAGAVALTGSLVLDAQGDPDALFIFKIVGALTSVPDATVTLVNGASSHNVFWYVVGAVALAAPTTFQGAVICDGAVSLADGVIMEGQAFSVLGAIALYNNVITANPAAPLPVVLTRFAAAAKPEGVAVSWATASEQNSDRFEVQRSADGRKFELLGTTKGQGNSSSSHAYTFADAHPLAGLAYYRLRQVDSNGSSAVSPVVPVRWQALYLGAYPNPTTTGLLTLPAGSGPVHYRVFSNNSVAVQEGSMDNNNLDISNLTKGIYLLELSGNMGRSVQRLVRE